MHEALMERASRSTGQTAIQWKKSDSWINISYGELWKNVLALSLALASDYGIRPGDRAAIMLGNRPEWPTLFFALLCAGAIPVPISAQGTPKETGNILEDSECRIVFTENGVDPSAGFKNVSVDSNEFVRALSSSRQEAPIARAQRDDVACIMYTSGTTGHPKGVMLSHSNLLSNIHSIYKLGLMGTGDGVVAVLPLYHTYAMVVSTLGPLIYGGRVIFPGSIRSKEVMSAVKQSKAKLFIGVPLIFEMIHKTVTETLDKMPGPFRFLIDKVTMLLYVVRKKTGVNLARHFFCGIHRSLGDSLRVYMSGGASLSRRIEKDMFKFGFTILNGYGLTETSPVLTVNSARKLKFGSAGRPIENVEIKIVKKNKKGIGEIFVRGPNIMKGYYKNEDLTSSVLEDGWFRTKDIGRVDKDGYLFITGRVDDAIALENGLSMCPDEIEEVYSQRTPIKDICVFDVPSSRRVKVDPVIWAIAVPDMAKLRKKGISSPHDAVKKAFEKVSKTIGIPERLMGFSLTTETLPRTLMGKARRKEIKELYLSGGIRKEFPSKEKRLTKADLKVMRKPLAGKVIDCLRTQTKVGDIAPGDSFELDLGIGLIGRSEIANELDKALGVKTDEDEINRVFTVGELIAYVEKISR